MAVIALAFVCQGEFAGAAGNQLAAQFCLQCTQYLADSGLSGLQFPGNRRETSALDHPDENGHCVELIHGATDSCQMSMVTIAAWRLIGMNGRAHHGDHFLMNRDRDHD